MKIGWTEVIIILILLFFTPNMLRLIIRKTYHEFMKTDEAKDNSSNNARQSSTANSSNTYQKYHNDEEFPYRKQEEQNPYTILKITNSATQNEITSAYRKLAQMYHPDKVAGLAPEYKEIAERKMKIINMAYQTLKK